MSDSFETVLSKFYLHPSLKSSVVLTIFCSVNIIVLVVAAQTPDSDSEIVLGLVPQRDGSMKDVRFKKDLKQGT